jgi:CRISPR/Cas system-associated protein Cas10 (large subunit of type III CRISPR-Cas system)
VKILKKRNKMKEELLEELIEIRIDTINKWYLEKGLNSKYLKFVNSMGEFCSCNEYCLTKMERYAEFGIDLNLFDYTIVFGKRTLIP